MAVNTDTRRDYFPGACSCVLCGAEIAVAEHDAATRWVSLKLLHSVHVKKPPANFFYVCRKDRPSRLATLATWIGWLGRVTVAISRDTGLQVSKYDRWELQFDDDTADKQPEIGARK